MLSSEPIVICARLNCLFIYKSLQIFRTHDLIHLLISNFYTFVGNLLKNCLANSAAPDKNQEKNQKCFRLVIVLVIVNVRNLFVFQRGVALCLCLCCPIICRSPNWSFYKPMHLNLNPNRLTFSKLKKCVFLLFILLYWANLAPSRHRPFKLGFHPLRGSHQDHPLAYSSWTDWTIISV